MLLEAIGYILLPWVNVVVSDKLGFLPGIWYVGDVVLSSNKYTIPNEYISPGIYPKPFIFCEGFLGFDKSSTSLSITVLVTQSALILDAYFCSLQKSVWLPVILPNINLFSICSIEPAFSIIFVNWSISSSLP